MTIRTTVAFAAIALAATVVGCSTNADLAVGKVEFPDDQVCLLLLASDVSPMVRCSAGPGPDALFLVDTGFSFSAVSASTSTLWGLADRRIPKVELITGSGLITTDRCARLPRLSCGQASAEDMDVLVLEDNAILPSEGVLGASLLGQYPVLIDGKRREIRFLHPDTVPQTLGMLYPDQQWSRIQLKWSENLRSPFVKLVVGTRSVRMLVDTGSTYSDVTPTVARDLNLLPIRTEKTMTGDASGTYLEDLEVFRLEDLRLGRWSCCLEMHAREDAVLHADQLDGTLGFDILRMVPCVFDAPHGMLWVQDPSSDTVLCLASTQDSRALAMFNDSLWQYRMLAALATKHTERRRLVPQVGTLLYDAVPGIQEIAAEVIGFFAQETWPKTSCVESAREWWRTHKDAWDNAPIGN